MIKSQLTEMSFKKELFKNMKIYVENTCTICMVIYRVLKVKAISIGICVIQSITKYTAIKEKFVID